MRGTHFAYIIISFVVVFTTHYKVNASTSGDKWRATAKSLLGTSASLIPEPEAPQSLRGKAFYTTASLALDRGFGLLETAYPASRLVTPVTKRIALPMIMKAHDKFASTRSSSSPKETTDDGKTRPNQLTRSGSFKSKFKSLLRSEPEATIKQVDAEERSDKKEENESSVKNDGESNDGLKRVNVVPSSSDEISGLKAKLKSRVQRRLSSTASKRFTIKHSPTPVARSEENEGSSNKEIAHENVNDDRANKAKERTGTSSELAKHNDDNEDNESDGKTEKKSGNSEEDD